jgi:hypothetical protein
MSVRCARTAGRSAAASLACAHSSGECPGNQGKDAEADRERYEPAPPVRHRPELAPIRLAPEGLMLTLLAATRLEPTRLEPIVLEPILLEPILLAPVLLAPVLLTPVRLTTERVPFHNAEYAREGVQQRRRPAGQVMRGSCP